MDFEQLVGHFAGRLAQGMRPDHPVTRMYARMMSRFGEHVLSKWSATSAAGIRCAIPTRDPRTARQCTLPAAGSCLVCLGPVCIRHGHVGAEDGTIICHACIARAQREHTPNAEDAVDEEALRRRFLELLGLDETADLTAIKAAYRRLAREHHPDRARDAADGRAREKRMKAFSQAYHWLIDREEAAA